MLAFLRAHDCKAVTIDNANVDPQAVYFPSETMVKYPTQAAYTTATRSFLAYVGPRLQAAGYELYPNIQDHHDLDVWRAAWRDWLPFISGGMRQHFLRWSNPGAELWGGQTWLEIVSLFEEVQRAGKSFHTATPLDDPKGDLRSLRYGRASWFVAWNGRSRSTYGGPVGAHVGELQEWRQEIGRPVEDRRLYAAGVWGKRYDAGIALVNTGDTPQVVDLGGEYRHPDGHTTSVVSLAGRHGLVLARGLPAEGRDLKARLNRLLTTIGALLFPGAADGLARDEVHEERWQDPAFFEPASDLGLARVRCLVAGGSNRGTAVVQVEDVAVRRRVHGLGLRHVLPVEQSGRCRHECDPDLLPRHRRGGRCRVHGRASLVGPGGRKQRCLPGRGW